MVDIVEARRLARLEETRRSAAEVLAAWEDEFAARVAAAFRAVFAPVLDRFGSTIVADPAGFASTDDLATIRADWVAEVDHTLAPMVSMMYDTGALSALLAHRGAVEARRADTVLDLLDDVLDRNAVAYLEQASNRLVGIGDAAWATARDTLLDGFTLGESVDDLAVRVQDALGVAENRAATIARTEVVSASNAGSYTGVTALGDYGPERKQWLATVDSRTRSSHADADGQTVGVDEAFTVGGYDLDYPGDPAGPPDEVVNCLLPGARVAWAGELLGVTCRRWAGTVVEVVTRDGDRATVTPNHPLLTDRGWLPAKDVHEGDQLRRAPLVEVGSEPHVDDMPPTVEEVHRAASETWSTYRVGGRGVNFHGDVGDREVEVVRPDRGLSLDREPRPDEVIGDRFLVSMGDRPRLAGTGDGERPLGRLDDWRDEALAARLVRCPSRVLSLAGGHAGSAEPVRFAPTPHVQPEGSEPSGDRWSTHAEVPSDGEHGQTFTVQSSQIVGVYRHSFDGHVYNLETTSGWYMADNLVHSNCRCTLVYVEADAEPHDLDTPGRGEGGAPSLTDSDLVDLAAAATPTTQETAMSNVMSNRAARRHAVRTRSGFTVPPPPERAPFAPGDPAVPAADPASDPAAAPVVPAVPAPAAPAVDPVVPAAPAPPPGDVAIEVPAGMTVRPFEVILGIEGRWTGDDRFCLPGAIRWDGMLPLPVDANHDETVEQTVGLIGEVYRVPGPNPGEALVVGRGFFDLGYADRPHEAAQFIVDRLESGVLRGASMSIDDETLGGVDPATVDPADDPWWMLVVEDCRLRAVTVCTVGAFAECGFSLDPEGVDVTNLPPAPDGPVAVTAVEAEAIEQAEIDQIEELLEDIGGEVVVVASGSGYQLVTCGPGADAPPAEWFEDPVLDGPTPLTVDDDGRVFGHLATWGTCHTGFAGQCITPPHSATGYAAFRTGEVVTAEGTRVATGRITSGTGHASTRLAAGPATAHYDDTGTAVADVAAGEDQFGCWVAGAVRPTATEEQVRVLRASPPSGDWRRLGTSMELVAALAVNSPGFPVPRARVASGVPQALVAANTPAATGTRRPRTSDEQAVADRIARTIGRDRPSLVASLADRVHPKSPVKETV